MVEGEKQTPHFFFQAIHPEALSSGAFAKGRTQAQNVKAVLEDILGHGNDNCILPGEIEANAARRTDAAGGLLFPDAEIAAFSEIAEECGQPAWKPDEFPVEG
jgi:L-2-hydroxycarboxylate dehydrogenase (NAD+)